MLLFTLVSMGNFLFSTLIILILYLKWHFQHWIKRGVKGPKPQLLSGTFPKSSAGKCNLLEELHEIYLYETRYEICDLMPVEFVIKYRCYKTKEKYVGIYTARRPKLFILDPQLAREILTTHFKCFHDNESSQWAAETIAHDYRFFDSLQTTPSVEQMRLCSPFVATGEMWKERRPELMPTLTTNRLRASYAALRTSAAKAVQYIATSKSTTIDAKELANRFTAQFMADFIWGIEANAFAPDNSRSPIHQMGSAMISQSLACVRYYGRTAAWPWLRKLRPVRFFPATSDRFFKQLVTGALEARAESTQERCDVIDHLQQLKQKKPLNDTQIAGHTTTVLIDGFETAAMLIAHCLLLLARNERVQQKLRQELIGAEVPHSFEAPNELPYLDQCIQETLRIFPPLSTLFKLCTEAITLPNADSTELRLQPGDAVYISSYSFQRDGDFYEKPEEFWPERFAEELGGVRKYRDMGVFLPFGNGPRQCPGMKLGLAEAKGAVAEIVKNFNLRPSSKTRADNKIAADTFLLSLDGGIELTFEKIP